MYKTNQRNRMRLLVCISVTLLLIAAIFCITATAKETPTIVNKYYPTTYVFTNSPITDPTEADFETNSTGTMVFAWYDSNGKTVTSPTAVGKYTLVVMVMEDETYATGSQTFSVTIGYLDTSAQASVSYTYTGEDGWYGGDATITAPDGWEISESLITFSQTYKISSSFNADYPYYLRNSTTKEIAKKSIPIKLDHDAPWVTSIVVSDVTDVSATVTVQGHDDHSGVKTYILYAKGQPLGSMQSGVFRIGNLTANTTYSFEIRVEDKAGQVGTQIKNSNNEFNTATVTFTTAKTSIANAQVSVAGEYIYNGQAQVPQKGDVTVTLDGMILTPDQYELSATNNVDAGGATLIVTAAQGGNYSGTLTQANAFTIQPKAVTVSSADAQDKTYDGTTTVQVTKAPLVGICGTDDVSVNLSAVVGTLPDKVAGTYIAMRLENVTLTGADASNYIIQSNVYENIPSDVTVARAPLTVSVTIKDKIYDGGTAATVDTVSFSGLVDGETFSSGTHYTVTEAYFANDTVENGKSVTVKITFTAAATANYTLTNVGSNGAVGTTGNIKAADLSTSSVIIDGTYTYNGQAQTPDKSNVKVFVKGVQLPESQYTVVATNNTNAGTATVTVTGIGDYTGSTTGTFTIQRAGVDSVNVSVAAPIAGETAQSSVTAGAHYTGSISWSGNPTTFAYNTVYTVNITLTPDANHTFTTATDAGDFTVSLGANGTLKLTKTYDRTVKAKITAVTAPSDTTLSNYCSNVNAAISLLPSTTVVTTEAGEHNMKLSWSCDGYDSSPLATNTFKWSVVASEYADYDVNGATLSGTVTVTNANAIPVTATGTDAYIVSRKNTYNVSTMFSFSTGAGSKSYTIIGGTGKGSISGNILTVSKSGTFVIRAESAANGSYLPAQATATLTYEIDKTGSSIVGVSNRGTYYTTQRVYVEDDNLYGITLNGVATYPNITLPGNRDATYTIEAYDLAGNTTTVVVYMKPIATLAKPIEGLTVDNVKSSDREAIEGVIEAVEAVDTLTATSAEKNELQEILDRCRALLAKIDEIKQRREAVIEAAEDYDLNTATSENRKALQDILDEIDALLATDNLTVPERIELEALRSRIGEISDRVNYIKSEYDGIEDALKKYDIETVKSTDKQDIEAILDRINDLLDTNNLTDSERARLEEHKKFAEALLQRIETAKNAVNTDDVKDSEGITKDNVKVEDKDVLEDAKADLESALDKYPGNYTDAEKEAIQDELDRINEALDAIDKIKEIQDAIDQLPNPDDVTPGDSGLGEDIKDIVDNIDQLPDDGKDQIGKDREDKLEDLLGALTDYRVLEGMDGIWGKGSELTLDFKTNGSQVKFASVDIDGAIIAASSYTVDGETLTVHLSASFLETLAIGRHTIMINFTDGEAATAFTVQPGEDVSGGFGWWWILLLILILIIIGGTTYAIVRNNKKKKAAAAAATSSEA